MNLPHPIQLSESVQLIYNALPPLFPLTADALFFYSLNLFLLSTVFQSLKMILHILINKQLAFVSKKYNSVTTSEEKILVLGDSTAVGTGASKPEETIAGRLGHDFPHAQIINLGKNGGLVSDVRKQVESVKGQTFSMIIISVGGNDVWHLTSYRSIRKNLEIILTELVQLCPPNRILFLVYNNAGSAPLFPPLLQFFLKRRSRKIQELIYTIAAHHTITTVDLFSSDENNPFLENPRVLFATDGIHPSSRGYELWYHRMWRELVQNGFRY